MLPAWNIVLGLRSLSTWRVTSRGREPQITENLHDRETLLTTVDPRESTFSTTAR
jgi:hypothetical protein